ncbi:hypothetical protein [Arthrobacter sp. zg-Y877]|uniref:hypothetical protein n=1 Tax=Arthrobacter sp. zg-Y877 TaxID=3049074 RepID=UPI0025A31806|nr:hypothetical protein [Arthrobacter sp. zg-Y877]MDM7989322.1 hypothetical protein [Arthrobacter sp. zg-Y877]
MKYMFTMRATDVAVKASKDIPFEQINQIGAYNESMINAGVMLGGEGLADFSEGSASSPAASLPHDGAPVRAACVQLMLAGSPVGNISCTQGATGSVGIPRSVTYG